MKIKPVVSVLVHAVVTVTFAAACRSTPPAPGAQTAEVPADTWAVVDGRAITRTDVDKAYGRMRDAAEPLSDEEMLVAKLSVLNDLILQDILMARARELKVEVPDAEVDAAYAEAKKSIADEAAFQKELTQRSLTAADMREGLRRELLSQKLIDQEVGTKITVSSQEVSDFFLANRAQFNLAEDAYHLAQIVITPVAEPQVMNRTGDDAATPEAAKTKVAMLMDRLKAGASFGDLAMDYSEDPQTAPRGGDLGLVPLSRLKEAPQQLRDAVLKKKPGTVNVASLGGAYTLVLVAAYEPAGQRDLSTPGMHDRITETLRARKEQLLRAAYLTTLREEAEVENYLARRIVDAQGVVPGAKPAPAAAKPDPAKP